MSHLPAPSFCPTTDSGVGIINMTFNEYDIAERLNDEKRLAFVRKLIASMDEIASSVDRRLDRGGCSNPVYAPWMEG